MALPPPPLPAAPAQRVPYAEASPLQLSQALVFVQQVKQDYYLGLGWESWVHALLTVQPDLWVTPHAVYLDEPALRRLARCLLAYLHTDVGEHLILGPLGPHFAQLLVDRQDDAIAALAELEAAPRAYGPAVYGLVTGLAAGDRAAHQVYQATEPSPHQRPRSAELAQARAAVPGRLQALHAARGESCGDRPPGSPRGQ